MSGCDASCGSCGSTFPRGYWHECPGDHVAEEAALRVSIDIAAWIARACQGWNAGKIANAIINGTWRSM